jgi:hydroxymethylbilane synthase
LKSARAIRIATRGSRLALWQAHAVSDRLQQAGIATEIIAMTTTGDRSQHGPVAGDDSKRQFVKELEEALLRGDADLAVHSAKDLPVILPEGLGVAACLEREDPRDAVVLRQSVAGRHEDVDVAALCAQLGDSANIGTGSVRRIAQLAPLFARAAFTPIRGNVDTRLARLDGGKVDALVLACAGLRRLGLGGRISTPLPVDLCVPAPGQGIVAVEIRTDDEATRSVVAKIHDVKAGSALAAERLVVVALGGGCQLPLGAIAVEADGVIEMIGVVASLDGSRSIKRSASGPASDPEGVARRLADVLESDGARALLDGARP